MASNLLFHAALHEAKWVSFLHPKPSGDFWPAKVVQRPQDTRGEVANIFSVKASLRALVGLLVMI